MSCDGASRSWARHEAAFFNHFAQARQALCYSKRKDFKAGSRCLHLHNGQREAQSHFLLQLNLNVMQAELLKLHPAEIMDIRRVAFHLLELKLHLRLRDHLPIIWTDDF